MNMQNKKITFATNTGPDTLEYTKLLLKSLKENLDNKEHEVLVFVDKDNDNTLEYLQSIKKDFYNLKIVTHNVKPIVGPERNINLIVDLATHDIVSYLQTDMVVSKHYDTELLKHLQEDMILSSTRIEPPLHGPSNETYTMNFGLTPEEFEWNSFLSYADRIKSDKIIDYFFAPFTFYKQAWYKIGGFDTNFRRSRCDSDLVQRALHLGIQIKQTYNANVYHFTCVTSRGKNWYDSSDLKAQKKVQLQHQADTVELRRFLRRWGTFSHMDSLKYKYDIDFVIKGDTTELTRLAYDLEPYGSRVWVVSQSVKDDLLNMSESEHKYANELWGFNDNDWKASKQYYNHTPYNQIYCVGEPKDYSVKIVINSTNDTAEFLQYTQSLRSVLESVELGTYQLGSVEIHIKSLVEVVPPLQMTNPIFESSLINIH
jgi:GT2 family glycosyltransferase